MKAGRNKGVSVAVPYMDDSHKVHNMTQVTKGDIVDVRWDSHYITYYDTVRTAKAIHSYGNDVIRTIQGKD